MGREDLTAHGFRGTFRDWCAETGQPSEISEAALAHTICNKGQAACQRGDMLDRRRKLMNDWADFCSRPSGDRTGGAHINGANTHLSVGLTAEQTERE
jgi:hypothetical protein